MQISHSGNRAKIVLNGVGDDTPGAPSNRSTTLYFKARAPGFLFFIQPIERQSGAARGRPQSARAIVVPMGQGVDRQRARQAAADLLRRQRTTGRPPTAVSLASASTVVPRVVSSTGSDTSSAAATDTDSTTAASLQQRQQEELYRNIGLLAAAGGRTRAAAYRYTGQHRGGASRCRGRRLSATWGRLYRYGNPRRQGRRREGPTAPRSAWPTVEGIGKFRHSFAMDYWCEVNCNSEKVRNCPKNPVRVSRLRAAPERLVRDKRLTR
ncbi:hypothetical protein FJT64_026750 [Amphibalanus amphitrite]|uniref:Uncharacterized protein n=1 Tax=Amphibalanus amphitrite TaxID=1232801 RepID=A0A6A4WB03_AMPAM|nr:hypothetical protein FJT64_026750 [Amphibalanus amphitrite]